jgi:hypothetical protein
LFHHRTAIHPTDSPSAQLDVLIIKQSLTIRHIEIRNAIKLTSPGIHRLAEACPNLIHLGLDNAVKVNNTSLIALLTHCPTLEYLRCSGSEDWMSSARAASIFDRLTVNPEIAKELVKIDFTNHLRGMLGPAVVRLSRARKGLEIVVGARAGAVKVWSWKRKKFLLPKGEDKLDECESCESDSSDSESSEAGSSESSY